MRHISQSAKKANDENTQGCKPLRLHPTAVQKTVIVSVPFPQGMEVMMTNQVTYRNPLKRAKNEHMSLSSQTHQLRALMTQKSPRSHRNLGDPRECGKSQLSRVMSMEKTDTQ